MILKIIVSFSIINLNVEKGIIYKNKISKRKQKIMRSLYFIISTLIFLDRQDFRIRNEIMGNNNKNSVKDKISCFLIT